jgi:hypothetical protein
MRESLTVSGERHRLALWRSGLILVALLIAGWSLAAGGDGAASAPGGVPFSIGLDLGPEPVRGILGERDVFTPPGSLLALGVLLEHVGFLRVPWPDEPFVEPLQGNLPAVWLPLRAWRVVAGGRERVPEAAILIRSPRLRLVPIAGSQYPVLLQYVGPGEMAEPLRLVSNAEDPGEDRFRLLVISFKDFLATGGDLPPEIVITGELILED